MDVREVLHVHACMNDRTTRRIHRLALAGGGVVVSGFGHPRLAIRARGKSDPAPSLVRPAIDDDWVLLTTSRLSSPHQKPRLDHVITYRQSEKNTGVLNVPVIYRDHHAHPTGRRGRCHKTDIWRCVRILLLGRRTTSPWEKNSPLWPLGGTCEPETVLSLPRDHTVIVLTRRRRRR